MNLNEFTYHKASPFYKQDFLPDRAWYNRKPKEFPSEFPSGQEFFPENGRRHYASKFNHSQIEHEDVLKSPQRFPFENRIALDKSYMRSLNTIDIEGASSNTRINQSIKNKYKARDQLIRRQNQSIQIRKPELTQQQKRRQIAINKYEESKSKALHKEYSQDYNLNSSRLTNNNPQKNKTPVSLKKDLTEEYKRFVMHNSSNKFNKDIPRADPIQQLTQPSRYSNHYQTISHDYSMMPHELIYNNSQQGKAEYEKNKRSERQRIANNYKPSSHYSKQFNAQQLRNSDQYRKIMEYEQSKLKVSAKNNDYRTNNQGNVSFSLAGQSIISN